MSSHGARIEVRNGVVALVVGEADQERVVALTEMDQRRLMRELLEAVSSKASVSPPPQHSPKAPDAIRAEFANAYKPWTQEEDALLLLERAKGHGIAHLARTLKRQPGAIGSRLKRLGDPSRS